MVYILWAILNLALLFYFIYICFNAAKLVKNTLGLFAAMVFVLGILALNCNSGKKSNDSNQMAKWYINKDTGFVSKSSVDIRIDKNLMYTINIGILYGNTSNSKIPVLLEAYPIVSGTFIGTDWYVQHISIYPTNNASRFKYLVTGITEWKLLNAVVSSQGKSYTGFFDLK